MSLWLPVFVLLGASLFILVVVGVRLYYCVLRRKKAAVRRAAAVDRVLRESAELLHELEEGCRLRQELSQLLATQNGALVIEEGRVTTVGI